MEPTEAEERWHLLLALQVNPDAFGALVAPRRARLLLLLVAAIGDWHEAEDGLQEALWQAFTRLRTLRAADAFDGWLRAVVVNEARDRLRKAVARGRREGLPTGDMADIERLAGVGDAGAEAGEGDCLLTAGAAGILAAIALLPPAERRVGTLVWLAGLSPHEIASTLGVPPGRPCIAPAVASAGCSTGRTTTGRTWTPCPMRASPWPATRSILSGCWRTGAGRAQSKARVNGSWSLEQDHGGGVAGRLREDRQAS